MLITLAIIGIIAALTVPTLMNKVQDHGFRSAFLKNYAMIKNAEKLAKRDGIPFFDVSKNGISNYYWNAPDELRNYFKIEGDVYMRGGGGGYIAISWAYLGHSNGASYDVSKQVKCLNGTFCLRGNSGATAFKTTDGSIIAFMTAHGWPWIIYIDVNGAQKPNTVGKDVFLLESHPSWNWEIVPVGIYKYENGGILESLDDCKMNSTGLSCGAEILKNKSFKIPKE